MNNKKFIKTLVKAIADFTRNCEIDVTEDDNGIPKVKVSRKNNHNTDNSEYRVVDALLSNHANIFGGVYCIVLLIKKGGVYDDPTTLKSFLRGQLSDNIYTTTIANNREPSSLLIRTGDNYDFVIGIRYMTTKIYNNFISRRDNHTKTMKILRAELTNISKSKEAYGDSYSDNFWRELVKGINSAIDGDIRDDYTEVNDCDNDLLLDMAQKLYEQEKLDIGLILKNIFSMNYIPDVGHVVAQDKKKFYRLFKDPNKLLTSTELDKICKFNLLGIVMRGRETVSAEWWD